MGRLGVSVALLAVGFALLIVGVFMAVGTWWACVVAGAVLMVYASVLFDVGERPARIGR